MSDGFAAAHDGSAVLRRGGRACVTAAGVADVDYGPCGMCLASAQRLIFGAYQNERTRPRLIFGAFCFASAAFTSLCTTNELSVHRTHARTSPASWIGEHLLHSPGCVSRHAGSRPGITSSVHGASSAAEHHVVHQTRALDSHTGRARHMHRTRAPDACTGCVHRSPDVRTGCAPGSHPGRAH